MHRRIQILAFGVGVGTALAVNGCSGQSGVLSPSALNVSGDTANAALKDAAATTSITIGETSVLTTADSGNANLLVAQEATLSQSATIESLSFYVTKAAGSLVLGIYDSSGADAGPGKLVAHTSSFTPKTGWNTKPVTSQVALTAGSYWLSYLPSSSKLSFVNSSTGSGAWVEYAFGAMPSSFGSPAGSGMVHWSFYATLSSSAVTPSPTPTESATPPPTSAALLGVVPSDQPNNATDAKSFAAWLGQPVQLVTDYIDQSSWSNANGDVGWDAPSYVGTGVNVVWSVPLTMSGTTLAQIANGSNDSNFQYFASQIAQSTPDATIRIGWEFNGNWYVWSVGVGGSAQDYVNAFQHVVGIFRAASPNFKFDWCPNWGSSSPVPAYPGDSYVDYIGLDTYDQTGNAASDWTSSVVNNPTGLSWQASFASEHGKPMSYPEWGAGQYGDDPAFIQDMYNWITAHNVAYQNYWNSTSSYNGCLTCGSLPKEESVYKSLFGK